MISASNVIDRPVPAPCSSRGRGQGLVIRMVQDRIDRGLLKGGEPLPTMRDIAETLSIDKGTVCRAMARLQDQGIVRRQGRRLCVVEHRVHAATPAEDGSDSGWPGSDASAALRDTLLVVTRCQSGQTRGRLSGWVGELMQGLVAAGHEANRSTMMIQPDALVGSGAERLLQQRPMGCVMLGGGSGAREEKKVLAGLSRAGVPVVLFGESLRHEGYDMVTSDHAGAAGSLVHGLASRGARRVLRYWPFRAERAQRPDWLARRDEGYDRAVRERQLPGLPALEHSRPELVGLNPRDYFEARVRFAAGYLVEAFHRHGPIDAIMTPTDQLAFEAAAACRLLGRQPNHDLLIAGFDADWEACEYRRFEDEGPAVTVAHDHPALARQMIDLLARRVEQPGRPVQYRTVPAQTVWVRDIDPATYHNNLKTQYQTP